MKASYFRHKALYWLCKYKKTQSAANTFVIPNRFAGRENKAKSDKPPPAGCNTESDPKTKLNTEIKAAEIMLLHDFSRFFFYITARCRSPPLLIF